jgi:hypothetical protein
LPLLTPSVACALGSEVAAASEATGIVGVCGGVSWLLMTTGRPSLAQSVPFFPSRRRAARPRHRAPSNPDGTSPLPGAVEPRRHVPVTGRSKPWGARRPAPRRTGSVWYR